MGVEIAYVSVTEAAELLSLKRNRIGVLCREGRFPGAEKVGNTWIIPRESVLNHTPLPPGVKPQKAKLAAERSELQAAIEAGKAKAKEV